MADTKSDSILRKAGNERAVVAGFSILLFALAVLSFAMGRYPVSLAELWSFVASSFTGDETDEMVATVITKSRLPRIAGAALVGAALSLSGAAYQGIFRNPMVSPDILGASAGAGFGAALGILLSLPSAGVQAVSFTFGLAAVAVSCLIGGAVGSRENATLVLVLSGMVVSALFSAFVSIIKYLADPYSKLPEITYWLMGGLSSVTGDDLLFAAAPAAAGAAVLLPIRWRLNVLAFGDEEASALGVDTKRLRLAVILCATLVTSSVVSVSGQIGWVGLVIPHVGRMLVGPNYTHLLPASIITGGFFLLLVDDVARNLLAVEIPLGILTAIIGAPFFVYLLLHGRKGWV
jgi:iron complex transport system permease protein